MKNFVRFGYIVNSRQGVICFPDTHKEALKERALITGTFEKSCMAGLEEEEEAESEEGSVDSSTLTHPPSARKAKPDRSTITTRSTTTGDDDDKNSTRWRPQGAAFI